MVSFNGSNGRYPQSSLLADANGDLFDTAQQGGAKGDGTVFEIVNNGTVAAPSYASAPTILASFYGGGNGEYPQSSLIADANGDLFGTTESGGASGVGTVFEIVNNGTLAAPNYVSTPTILATFNGGNGAQPNGSLIADANGDLFGTTQSRRELQLRYGIRDRQDRLRLCRRPHNRGQLQRQQRHLPLRQPDC